MPLEASPQKSASCRTLLVVIVLGAPKQKAARDPADTALPEYLAHVPQGASRVYDRSPPLPAILAAYYARDVEHAVPAGQLGRHDCHRDLLLVLARQAAERDRRRELQIVYPRRVDSD